MFIFSQLKRAGFIIKQTSNVLTWLFPESNSSWDIVIVIPLHSKESHQSNCCTVNSHLMTKISWLVNNRKEMMQFSLCTVAAAESIICFSRACVVSWWCYQNSSKAVLTICMKQNKDCRFFGSLSSFAYPQRRVLISSYSLHISMCFDNALQSIRL